MKCYISVKPYLGRIVDVYNQVRQLWVKQVLIGVIALLFSPSAFAEVTVLKHPYPYKASVTINSDRHSSPLATVDAVHRLVMGNEPIPLDSVEGELIFGKDNLHLREIYGDAVPGFNFPLADSFWLVGEPAGVYARHDKSSTIILNDDYASHLDRLMATGRTDTIHTFGIRPIVREQALIASKWLLAEPYRRPTVWVSHSFSQTPSGAEPSLNALPIITKNLVKRILHTINDIITPIAPVLRSVGMGIVVDKLSSTPNAYAYPPDQISTAHSIIYAGIALVFWAVALLLPSVRNKSVFLWGWLIAVPIFIGLSNSTQLDYSHGDNPQSKMYNIDIIQSMGVKYYWFIIPREGYPPHIKGKLQLPEHSLGGKDSIFIPLTLDDGSQILAFSRNSGGFGGMQSSQLLTEKNLAKLIESEGFSIMYTHWFGKLPGGFFAPKGMAGLQRLAEAYRRGDVWVVATGKMLKHHHAASFLDYSVNEVSDETRINIKGLNDPVYGAQSVSKTDLAGVSFAVDNNKPLTVVLDGVDLSLVRHEDTANNRIVWQVPL